LSTDASSRNPASGAQPIVRDVLERAWPLFKASVPVCLPLAVVGVAACATPGAESVASGEGYGFVHGREWWGLVVASMLLTLICYGAVLLQQLALAGGSRAPLLDSLRGATRALPASLGLMLLLTVPLAPAMLATAALGFGVLAAALTLLALVLLVHALLAWPALLAGGLSPFAALAASSRTVRLRWRFFLSLAATLLAAILVFVMLSGILIGVVMGLAGQAMPSPGGLAFSRWLMALILAVPVVYAGAVTVAAWQMLRPVPATPRDPVQSPAP
jgi:hypothetical protein